MEITFTFDSPVPIITLALSKRHRMVQNGTELVQNGTECLKGTEWYRIKVSKRHRMVQNENV